MKILNTTEIKNLETKVINEIGIPSLVLMERASFSVFDYLKNHLIKNNNIRILILAGNGNNGGDAIALSRMFFLDKIYVELCIISENSNKTNENNIQFEIISKLGVNVIDFENIGNNYDLIIDGIFGSGLSRELNEYYKNTMDFINNLDGIKIALDIPSGINGNTGEVMGKAFIADYTFTFGFYKVGLLMDSALDYVGKLILTDIGLPYHLSKNITLSYLTEEKVTNLLKPRSKNSYKNKFGRTLIIGGQENMSGALVLATNSALRSGTGLVNVMTEKSIHSIVATQVPSAMVISFDNFENFIEIFNSSEKPDTILFGIGSGKNATKKEILEYLIKNFEKTLVIDADGLNLLAENIDLLKSRTFKTIITPHIGEFSRLSGFTSVEIQKNKLLCLKDFLANKNNLVVVLKGAKSLISDGKKTYINSTGNAIFSRGGSGDILSGLIAGLSTYNDFFEASLLGTYIHGLAGDLALEDYNENSVLTEELLIYISKAYKKLAKVI